MVLINQYLIEDRYSLNLGSYFLFYVLDRFSDPAATVTVGISIAQLPELHVSPSTLRKVHWHAPNRLRLKKGRLPG